MLTKLAWITLALIHLSPALVWVFPGLIEKLYGVPSGGEIERCLSTAEFYLPDLLPYVFWRPFTRPVKKLRYWALVLALLGF